MKEKYGEACAAFGVLWLATAFFTQIDFYKSLLTTSADKLLREKIFVIAKLFRKAVSSHSTPKAAQAPPISNVSPL
jgi:hypothetical protein